MSTGFYKHSYSFSVIFVWMHSYLLQKKLINLHISKAGTHRDCGHKMKAQIGETKLPIQYLSKIT